MIVRGTTDEKMRKANNKAGIPDKVDINGTHCASKNYSISSLWIVNSLINIESKLFHHASEIPVLTISRTFHQSICPELTSSGSGTSKVVPCGALIAIRVSFCSEKCTKVIDKK